MIAVSDLGALLAMLRADGGLPPGAARRCAEEQLLVDLGGIITATAHRWRHAAAAVGLDAEDLAQEARLAILSAAERFDPGRGSGDFLAFAVQRLRWALIRALRRARPAGCARGPLPTITSISDMLPARESDPAKSPDVEALRTAVDRLPPRSRAVLSGIYETGLSREELAERFSISAQRVSQVEARALFQLQRALAPGMVAEIRRDSEVAR